MPDEQIILLFLTD